MILQLVSHVCLHCGVSTARTLPVDFPSPVQTTPKYSNDQYTAIITKAAGSPSASTPYMRGTTGAPSTTSGNSASA